MYCSNCGLKADKEDKFCSRCGNKVGHLAKDSSSDKALFKKISLTSLELMNAQGDKWKKNTELMPDDCWALLANTSKAQAQLFMNKNGLDDNGLSDLLFKGFFKYYSYGLWIWVAVKQNTDPGIFKGRIKYSYPTGKINTRMFLDEWEANLDNIDKDISDDIKPSFAIAQKMMEDAVNSQKLLYRHLDPSQLLTLKSDLLGAIYRGYYLHKYLEIS